MRSLACLFTVGTVAILTMGTADAFEEKDFSHTRHPGAMGLTETTPFDPHGKYQRIKHGPRYHYHRHRMASKPYGESVIELDSDVLFDFGSATLKPQASTALKEAMHVIKRQAAGPIFIEGHTDAIGNKKANMALSLERAQSVKIWFDNHCHGLDYPLMVTGYGETRPIAPNAYADGTDDPIGRARNRRVELRMTAHR